MQVLQRVIKRVYHQIFPESKGSWEINKKNIKLDPPTIIASSASVTFSNPPPDDRCLVEIGRDSQIFGQLFVLRQEAKISIGQRCQINNCSLVSATGIQIGDDVMIAGGTAIWDNDSHSIIWEERMQDVLQCGKDYQKTPEDWTRHKDWTHVKMHPIIIHDKVWIGMNVMILKGVTIGEGAVIGAMSVVTHDVPPYTLVVGNPAKAIRSIPGSITKIENSEKIF